MKITQQSHIFAAVYGDGTFSCSQYTEGCITGASSIDAPSTGFFAQPAYVVYPSLLAGAFFVAIISFSIVKLLRRR